MDTAILLYTISNDDLRDEFTKELERKGFEKHPDQSTYSYSMNKVGDIFLIERFSEWLIGWCKHKPFIESDFISVYYLDYIRPGSKFTAIKNRNFTFKK